MYFHKLGGGMEFLSKNDWLQDLFTLIMNY